MATKLEKERELVGMYLSAHPLDPYYMELNYGTSCTIKGFTEFVPVEGVDLTFGGMVVDFQQRQGKNGMFGILKIEDYTGSAEFMLFGQTFIDFHNYGVPGTPIIISGQYQRRFAKSELRFNIGNIRLLHDVKGSLVRGITIDLPTDRITPHLRSLLSDRMAEADGNDDGGELAFRIFDPTINRSLHLSASKRIPVDRKLVEALTQEDISFTIEK